MYNINRQPIHKVKRRIYIASKEDSVFDDYGNEIPKYSKPQKYMFNVQALTNSSEIREFGEIATALKRATITEKTKYLGKFKEFDKVYIYNNPSSAEVNYGDNADYRVYLVREQNTAIVLYLLKLVK